MEIFYSNNICVDTILLSAEESVHCVRVLRNRKGDEVKVSGGDGNLYRCVVENDDPSGAELRIVSVENGFGGHDYFLHMAVAPTKNIDRYEWFIEKATEIGIDEITPLVCDHSERKVLKRERGERIVLSAAKQSLKGFVPELHDLTSARDFIAQSATFAGAKFIAYCDSELVDAEGATVKRIPLPEAIAEAMKSSEKLKVMVLIGPEGDFSLAEIRAAAAAGFIPVSLGQSRLRTETAALVAVVSVYTGSIRE